MQAPGAKDVAEREKPMEWKTVQFNEYNPNISLLYNNDQDQGVDMRDFGK